jgi:3-deoxy-D-manno-octulosonic-acid transferase
MRLFYTMLLYLATPFVLLRLLWRSRAIRGYRQRIPERFGIVPRMRPNEGVAVWVHAVSVGESMAAIPMIQKLVLAYGKRQVWVTTTTPTGSDRIRAALGDLIIHTYAPYDLPTAVYRFLERAKPAQVIIMETELWPNLFAAIGKRRIPLTIANGRLSPRSYRGYSRVGGFTRDTLRHITLVAAQSEADAERFRRLGAPKVESIGNLKFDIEPRDDQIAAGAALRARFGPGHPAWVAASTHDGEEVAALEAHKEILKTLPEAVLLLVPRHPQRFDEVSKAIVRSGLDYIRRSGLPDGPGVVSAQVLLGDSLGEMWMYLSAADVAFIGGSLVPVGGHNVLEPAALGLPVLFGPHMHNFVAARDLLIGAKSAYTLDDARALKVLVLRLLQDRSAAQAMGRAGRAAVLANRGALDRLLERLGVPKTGG